MRCPSGHCYDRAAAGYLHLLPANRMNSRLPGDNKEMVAARRAFLEAGYYAVFSDAVSQTAVSLLRERQARLHRVVKQVAQNDAQINFRHTQLHRDVRIHYRLNMPGLCEGELAV